MRLRCPNENCPIDVPDDFAGVRMRCPHCGHLFFVDPKYADPPDLSLGEKAEKPKTPIKLENQIYDGLPPLAVMLALRRQQASQAEVDALAAQHPMTEDDWKALSAFESVIDSVLALRTTIWFGLLALIVNLLVWAASPREVERKPLFMRMAPIVAVTLGICFVAIYKGSQTLQRIRLDLPAVLLPWSALVVALMVGGSVILNLAAILDPTHDSSLGFLIYAAMPFNALAAFDSTKSAWRVGQSLERVSPPEISHRLTEALKYLE